MDMSQPDADGVYRGGSAKRRARTELAMECLRRLWSDAVAAVPFDVPSTGIGFGAVGSLARGQIGPSSDLDLVIIYEPHTINDQQLNELTNKLWYPLWDSGLDLDQSVRTRQQCEAVTDSDLPAAMGWLDVKPIAGDTALISATATSILERWRRAVRKRLPELLNSARKRLDEFGRLAYLNQPDIKEARGGLRDSVLVSALTVSWLADRPHGRYDDEVEALLDVRDCIHLAAGKDANRLLAPYQAQVAAMRGLADPTLPPGEREARSIEDLQTRLARIGRQIAFALDSTASRAEHSLTHERPRFSFFQMLSPRGGGRREARSSNRSRPAWPSTSRKSCWLRAWNRSRTGICRCAWPRRLPSSSCRSARSPCRTCGAARSAIPCGMMSRANCSCVCWPPGRRSCACGRNWISWIYPVDGCLNGWAYAIARARLQRTGIPSTGTASR